MKKWLVLILLASLWGYGLIQCRALQPFREQVFLYYEEGQGVKEKDLSDAAAREKEQDERGITDITAWSAGTGAEVGNRELGRKKKASCISVYG